MEALDSIFCISPDSADFNIDLKTILDALGLVVLRRELLDQFNQLSLPTSLLTGMSNWYTTVSVWVEDLVGRPIILRYRQQEKPGKIHLQGLLPDAALQAHEKIGTYTRSSYPTNAPRHHKRVDRPASISPCSSPRGSPTVCNSTGTGLSKTAEVRSPAIDGVQIGIGSRDA